MSISKADSGPCLSISKVKHSSPLYRISLELPDPCTTKNHVALATARAEVEVRLDGGKVKANFDDDKSYERAKAVDMGDLGDGDDRGRSSSDNDIALSDDQNYYRKGSTAAARQRDRMSRLSGKSVQIRRPMSQVVMKVENVG